MWPRTLPTQGHGLARRCAPGGRGSHTSARCHCLQGPHLTMPLAEAMQDVAENVT